MLLGIDELKKLIKENNLVEGLLGSEFQNPVGTGFDFRVGELHKIKGEAYLGKDSRTMPETELVASEKRKETAHIIRPGEYYLIKTIEKVNLPDDIILIFYPRSTIYRSGIYIYTGLADPGYRGELTFGITNLSSSDFKIEMGARIVHGLFFRISGESSSYKGIWQGGRMT